MKGAKEAYIYTGRSQLSFLLLRAMISFRIDLFDPCIIFFGHRLTRWIQA